MSVSYTNRKGRIYFLCQAQTKSDKPRYYFAREPKEGAPEHIPAGYKISESVNGVVSLVKDRPVLILPEELASVEAELEGILHKRRYRVGIKHNRIEVYEMYGPDADGIANIFGKYGFPVPGSLDQLRDVLEETSQFYAVLRFILIEVDERTFLAQRWCSLGGIDDWVDVEYGSIQELAPGLIPVLGTDEYYEL
jgi:hypothetical protein